MNENIKNKTRRFAPVLNTNFTGKTLVVEDSRTNQRLVTIILKKLGFEVEIAENGQEALDKVERSDFDLIFMDIQMPIMNGYEATRELRNRNVKTPIIALTANAMKGDEEKCLQAGCDRYMSKPIDRTILLQIINSELEKSNNELHEEMDKVTDQIDELNEMCHKAAAAVEKPEPKIDIDAALRTCGELNVVVQIAQTIVDNGPSLLSELVSSISNGSAKDSLLYAHRLRGNALTIGASEFAEKALKVEQAAKNNDLPKAEILIPGLKEELDKLINFISQPDWIEKVKQ